MRSFVVAVLLALFLVSPQPAPAETAHPPVAIAIHGGAGTILRENLSEAQDARIRGALAEALQAGHDVLTDGGSAIDAVIAAITRLEDAPDFNAGRGAVLTHDGRVELDASLMRGHDRAAGAVAGVRGVRHPILAARAVMDHSPHVLLAGSGAEAFIRNQGLEFMSEDWFITDFRRRQLETIQAREQAGLAAPAAWYSTVGAVALDRGGNLAAGTSTGGMSNKRWGRVGDSPIIGAGTFADNQSCAVSATGHGEFFIRYAVAHEICARMRLAGASLAEAAEQVVNGVLVEAGGSGGVIAIDAQGNIAMPFNTPGMYRGSIDRDGNRRVAIHGDE
ncbi:MAG: isoaspartyl peptidase/L-asparaginase [Wenzhouxiangellaceae bacterium]|nr:isoaspartyl peptidase/L-asparaginase [Wenzhouxiangellaceae bacterium]